MQRSVKYKKMVLGRKMDQFENLVKEIEKLSDQIAYMENSSNGSIQYHGKSLGILEYQR